MLAGLDSHIKSLNWFWAIKLRVHLSMLCSIAYAVGVLRWDAEWHERHSIPEERKEVQWINESSLGSTRVRLLRNGELASSFEFDGSTSVFRGLWVQTNPHPKSNDFFTVKNLNCLGNGTNFNAKQQQSWNVNPPLIFFLPMAPSCTMYAASISVCMYVCKLLRSISELLGIGWSSKSGQKCFLCVGRRLPALYCYLRCIGT